MKKILSLAIILCCAAGFAISQNAQATTIYNGKLLFVKTIPTNEYTVVGKTKVSNSNKDEAAAGMDPSGIKEVIIAIDKSIKKETKGKQVAFDAVIVHSPNKIELIKFKSGTLAENAGCNIISKDYKKKCGKKDIFFLTKPAFAYTEVKEIEVKNFTGLGQMKMGKDDIDNFFNKLYERSCKEADDGVDFDAIMMVDDNVAVKGYFEAKTLKLIKYK
ncbi:MAG TPA: hypothetical protein PLZ52_02755 [Bacteroidales bacterium]|nr:hypothetical protein [Bacteroidales bacterium]HQL70714.1 hypothetical protein [Bacteroidales bacterium]